MSDGNNKPASGMSEGMKHGSHKDVFEYDGAFHCRDCGQEWGALSPPAPRTAPEKCECKSETAAKSLRRKFDQMMKLTSDEELIAEFVKMGYTRAQPSDSSQRGLREAERQWLQSKLADAEKSLRCREEGESAWRNGTDEEWKTVAKMHGGAFLNQAARNMKANTEARIAAKCRNEVEMFKAVIAALSTPAPQQAGESLRVAVEALRAQEALSQIAG